MRATIFVNRSSGRDSKEGAAERVQEVLRSANIDAQIEPVDEGDNLADKSKEAVESGADLVVAGGGDGTLSATASSVAGTAVTFGVLPVGTLNHFARDLGIPLDLEQATRVIVDGETRVVDVAEVNGKVFLNNSIIGLYPIYRFVKARHEERVGNRRLALLMATFSVFRRYPLLNVRLIVDGAEINRKTPYILIANNRHAMEGYSLGTRETLTEGKLWIYVLKNRGRWGLLRLLAKLITGQFRAEDDFELFSSEEVVIRNKRGKQMGVALDGEVRVMMPPLHYRILPKSLKVRVPKAA